MKGTGISATKLAEMIEDATVDAHDESEQAMGWLAMFEEHLELPFETVVLGVPVRVTRIDSRDDGRLVTICRAAPALRRSREGTGRARSEIETMGDHSARRPTRRWPFRPGSGILRSWSRA